MTGSSLDPLLLGQRVIAVLETGLRTATYKLATLMALVEHSLENVPVDPDARLTVPILDFGKRVLDLYWRQVQPFAGRDLKQSTQVRARIPEAVLAFRAASGAGGTQMSVAKAAVRNPEAHRVAVDKIALCLAQQPLHRLQRLPGSTSSDCFLFDAPFSTTGLASSAGALRRGHRAGTGRGQRACPVLGTPQAGTRDPCGSTTSVG